MKYLSLTLIGLVSGFILSAQTYEILVLGTAQDAGYPQVGCTKECCQDLDSKEPVASIAVATTKEFWIVDATPDFTTQYAQAKQAFPNQTFAGILLTHAHIGHYTGLMYLGKEAMNAEKVPVYCLPRMANFLRNNGPWSQLVSDENIAITELEPGKSFPLVKSLNVTAIEVPHRDEYSETAGFLFASLEKKTLYIPDIDDWNSWQESIDHYVQMLDIIFIDGTFYSDNELPGRDMTKIPHPRIEDTMQRFRSMASSTKGKIYFIHFNHTNPVLRNGVESKDLEEQGFQIARRGLRL